MSGEHLSAPTYLPTPGDKRLDEMNRLTDMLHFPALVNSGATFNVIVTIVVTYLLVPRYSQTFAPALWIGIVLCLNLLPVVLLRRTMNAATPVRSLRDMHFISDQHKFSDWVYLAASANMAFWILAAWSLFSVLHTPSALLVVLVIAFLATFSPILARAAGILRH